MHTQTTQSRWALDPSGRYVWREWTGSNWTGTVHDGEGLILDDPIPDGVVMPPPTPPVQPVDAAPSRSPGRRTTMARVAAAAVVVVALLVAVKAVTADGGDGATPDAGASGSTPTTAAAAPSSGNAFLDWYMNGGQEAMNDSAVLALGVMSDCADTACLAPACETTATSAEPAIQGAERFGVDFHRDLSTYLRYGTAFCDSIKGQPSAPLTDEYRLAWIESYTPTLERLSAAMDSMNKE